ncbi:cell division protein ZapA [Apibacter sp. B3706]|uniref:cell division protein ZapA n=1 Tax=Apibacter TaxID=1778601 RepID=UPI000CF97C18|nr:MULTISPECIES: cell division protein ZapA [Apibacter]MCX8677325.1 cell division protein ZapA [Apibacter sp. B3919]MXO25545.1 cell division protein ZapA [Apibacter sp. B3924]MXO26800.1 cell division protein ZapA [Apibacter sp. B3813]MXO28630.1 cell division protein ZapA [Apibacter sp. B3913]MXO30584.1 cell division protein ZapA [Apibacter sp. B3912]
MSQKVNIRVAGRNYPLVVQSEEEEILRIAAKKIEKYINTFEKNYNISEKQDALAMAALQLASELENILREKSQEQNEILLKIKKIKKLL